MSAPSQARSLRARPADRLAGLPAHAGALAAIVGLAAALRFATLSVQSYWLDEAVTVQLLHRSFGGMLAAIPNSESTPPLYYVLAWLWTQVFGTGEAGLRSLSALIGVITVPVAYSAAARLVTPRAGLVVAAIAAVNPLLVWFSQEARAYALLVLLAAASLALFARVLERPARRELAWWAVLSALALCAHYFALFVVVPEAVWLIWRSRGRPEARAVRIAVAGVALAGAALLPLAIVQAGNDRAGFIRRIGLARRVVQVPKQFLVGFDAPAETATAVVALVLAAFGLWLLATRADARERSGARRAALILVPALGVPIVLAIAGADYLIARNMIAAWVPAAIVVGAGLGARRAGRAGLAAAALLCALSLAVVIEVAASPAYQRGDWRGAAHALGPLREPRGLVITPLVGHVPLALYATPSVQRYPRFLLPLREIDVIAMAERRTGQTPTPPRPANPPPPPPGFTLVERRQADTYTLLRYRSPVFRYVDGRTELAPMRLGGVGADVVVQVPRGWIWTPPSAPPAPTPPGHLP